MLQPNKLLTDLQLKGKLTELMMLQEEIKTYPLGDIWQEFCKQNDVPETEEWFNEIKEYEKIFKVKEYKYKGEI